jgi:16S rRNA (cytosine967-C5)-methyltransferase
MQATLQRLGLMAELVLADARKTSVWWDGKLFDRILLDAPCSGTGVIRRHPDIKVLRKPEDVAAATALQAGLLAALWPLLATGGKLLYVACSILDCENDQQIENFINMQTDAGLACLKAGTGTATRYGRRILPGEYDMDGFYYACLEKK